jgi:alkylhydroperoxidase family enzyme
LARRAGATQDDLDALRDPARWDAQFAPELQAALALADAITQGNGHVSDELWARAAGHFDETQLVEIVADIGLFNYFNRFNNALEVEVTRPGWPER